MFEVHNYRRIATWMSARSSIYSWP